MSSNTLSLNSNNYNYKYFQNADVCRLCWNRNAVREIYKNNANLAENEIKDNLLEEIQFSLNIMCVDTEGYPNKLCEKCYQKTKQFYTFKLFCIEADNNLKEIMNKKYSDSPLENDNILVEVKLESMDEFSDSLYASDCDAKSMKEHTSKLISSKSKRKVNRTSIAKITKKKKRTSTYCNICRIDYEDEDQFSIHNEKFHGILTDGSYKCFGCDKTFQSRKTRIGHEIKSCKGLTNGYQCSVCDRYLPKRRMFESHMRDHRLNKPIDLPDDIFKCRVCKKKYKTKEELKIHSKNHDDEQKHFVCEVIFIMISSG